jgi:stage II sporulation protein D
LRRIIVALPAKNLVFGFLLILLFLLFLPILIIGISSNNNNTNISTGKSSNNKTGQYSLKDNDVVTKHNSKTIKIKVERSKENRIEEMNLEDYVRGVVSAEMPVTFDIEALKAQAVAARTYALAKIKSGVQIDDTVNYQAYMSKSERMKSWPKKEAEKYWARITDAVQGTSGQVLTYDGKLVTSALFFAMSGGRTEDSAQVFGGNVPYLKSVDSPDEDIVPKSKFRTSIFIKYQELANKINRSYPKAKVSASKLRSQISIKSRNSGGTVNDLRVGNVTIKGRKFRELLGLSSANFSINFLSNSVEISCVGSGHGVGMSQWGANAMAKSGKKYVEILTHYYTGVKVEKIENIR